MLRLLLGVALIVGVVVALPGAGRAQDVRVQVARGPYYLGEAVEIQVIASDFEEDSAPEVVAGQIASGQLRYGGVSNSSSTSISFVNGRMSRVKEVLFVFRFDFIGTSPGRVRIPGFAVSQGATKRTTDPFDLTIAAVPKTGLVSLSVALPDRPIFVGQRVPVDIEFRIDREAQQDLLSYQATIPLFDSPDLRFIDDPSAPSDTQLEIETQEGTLRLPATSQEEQVAGRVELVFRARRTMIALAAGRVEADPPRVIVSRGTRFRRDLFNQRRAGSAERLMAEGDPVELEVIEVPRAGRPESFAGAVGEGFTLEVAADRSVVQLGEPILVSFSVRGDGDLSTAGLPPLDAEGLFDPNQFRLPEDPPAGLIEDGGKRFETALRVLDAEVREIPAIAYSWFDAESRRFETTYSRPIALSVGAAEIIGADAVSRREGSTPGAQSVPRPTEAESASQGKVRSTSLAFSGANLAVEQDAATVLAAPVTTSNSRMLLPLLYGVSIFILLFAAFDHRRRSVDPLRRERARVLRETKQGIEAAAKGEAAEAAAALGRTLRELIAALPEEADEEFDALLAECDALQFSPTASGGGLPRGLVDRAKHFVDQRDRDAKGSEGDE